tara:strand:- start:1207 stop:1482 length:276 start_codon:yes stop_codon:yes gene_type:complete
LLCIKFYPNFIRRDFHQGGAQEETKKISSKRKKRQQQQARRESKKNKGEIREILDDDFRDIFDLKIHDRQTPIFTTLEGTENIFIARALCD